MGTGTELNSTIWKGGDENVQGRALARDGRRGGMGRSAVAGAYMESFSP